MRYGSVVKHKKTGEYGTVHYSAFGASIHTYNEETKALGKTLGDTWYNVLLQWEEIEMPKDYEWDESYLYIRKI